MEVVKKLPVVVLISGNGSNLQSLIDQINQKKLDIEILAVISNKPSVFGLNRAQKANIPTEVIEHKLFADRESYDAALMACIDSYQPRLVILAGFMRILTTPMVNHYLGHMLNIHPSLLPSYKGLNTHQRALDDKADKHGVSVHFVSSELDGGPVILQSEVEVKPTDTKKTLAMRVQQQETIIYPMAIQWFAESRLKLENNMATLDNQSLNQPLILENLEKSDRHH